MKRRVLGPVKHIIDNYLQEDEKRPQEQRHSARRIYHRLVEGHGFEGSESTVRRYVREKKAELKYNWSTGKFTKGNAKVSYGWDEEITREVDDFFARTEKWYHWWIGRSFGSLIRCIMIYCILGGFVWVFIRIWIR